MNEIRHEARKTRKRKYGPLSERLRGRLWRMAYVCCTDTTEEDNSPTRWTAGSDTRDERALLKRGLIAHYHDTWTYQAAKASYDRMVERGKGRVTVFYRLTPEGLEAVGRPKTAERMRAAMAMATLANEQL